MVNSKTQRLLLVEDSSTDADLFCLRLEQVTQPFQISHVTTLKAAIEACKNSQFDAVLLDLNLPDSQGVQTVAEFCGIVHDAPVIILTGVDEQRIALKAISAGAQDYLVKDEVSTKALVNALQYARRRHRLRQQLVQRNEELFKTLDQTLKQGQLKTSFLGAAMHQIKSPVNLIGVCVEALKQTSQEVDADLRSRRLMQIERAVSVVFEFLDAMQLMVANADASKTLKIELLDLPEFCENIIASLRFQFVHEPQINLYYPPEGVNVRLEPILVRYILSNLLNNAVKYSKDDAAIVLEVQPGGEEVTFVVSDRGIGIPAVDQAHILEPFYRADNARECALGNGLGLAIVASCLELHQGTMEIDSELDVGTTVTVTLPVIPA